MALAKNVRNMEFHKGEGPKHIWRNVEARNAELDLANYHFGFLDTFAVVDILNVTLF